MLCVCVCVEDDSTLDVDVCTRYTSVVHQAKISVVRQ